MNIRECQSENAHLCMCVSAKEKNCEYLLRTICGMQRTIPTVIKFLGPFVLLLLSLLRFAGALKRNTALGGSVVVADSSNVLLIKGAMQAHESQYVWYALSSPQPSTLLTTSKNE